MHPIRFPEFTLGLGGVAGTTRLVDRDKAKRVVERAGEEEGLLEGLMCAWRDFFLLAADRVDFDQLGVELHHELQGVIDEDRVRHIQ